jgi:hypothetical protein
MQGIKALRAGQLHSHLTREGSKTLQDLYDNFKKIRKKEVLHFRKLEQQRNAPKESEASIPARYNRGRPSTNNYDSTTKHVNNINSGGYEPLENRK